jgi:hypothetical protein
MNGDRITAKYAIPEDKKLYMYYARHCRVYLRIAWRGRPDLPTTSPCLDVMDDSITRLY